ncbi:putative elongation factor Ts [Babesia sp. Xinjiang]|uniref:putative elongation factor Ts n=1 Tax=Babesia sp. Xinjiang TaxID=462227 RepID=UPI000A2604DF|nr:putative elongation factor Ts [Babesia sp. Xinjiang]ORM39959.1 putative elongation factor Ts [Babesia sp. Xinjiang]
MPLRSIGFTRSYTTGQQPDNARRMEAIKQLRKVTRGGIAECKEALMKCNWDVDAAIRDIRKMQQLCDVDIGPDKQLFGKIALPKDISRERKSVILELSCNCDFITSSKEFAQLSSDIRNTIQKAVDTKDIDIEQTGDTSGTTSLNISEANELIHESEHGTTVQQMLQRVSAEYKRRIMISNIFIYQRSQCVDNTGVYVHHKSAIGESVIGDRLGIVNIRYHCKSDTQHNTIVEPLTNIAKSLALQLVSNPRTNHIDDDQGNDKDIKKNIRHIIGQPWLQKDLIEAYIEHMCSRLGIKPTKLTDDMTIQKTFKLLQANIDTTYLGVHNALYMATGTNPIIYTH